jgi:hypothetical protein
MHPLPVLRQIECTHANSMALHLVAKVQFLFYSWIKQNTLGIRICSTSAL